MNTDILSGTGNMMGQTIVFNRNRSGFGQNGVRLHASNYIVTSHSPLITTLYFKQSRSSRFDSSFFKSNSRELSSISRSIRDFLTFCRNRFGQFCQFLCAMFRNFAKLRNITILRNYYNCHFNQNGRIFKRV